MKIEHAVFFIDQSTKFLLVQQGLTSTSFYAYDNYDEMISDKLAGDIGFWRLKQKK